MSKRRAARIAELIREEASQIILYQLRDPRIQSITITRVDVSGDLRYAKVYFSVLGDEAQQRTVARGLASARGLVQSRIGKTLGLRESPSLSFEYDPSIAKSIEISKLLDQIAAERKPKDDALPPDAASLSAKDEEKDGLGHEGDEDEVPPEELPEEDDDADDDEAEWPKREEDEHTDDDREDDSDENDDEDSDDDDWDDMDDEEKEAK
jgi:ribosome-binding factor A